MENELKINEIEVIRLDIKPGQVLAVTVYSDDIFESDLHSLRAKLQNIFPDNKIILFSLPVSGKMEMAILDSGIAVVKEQIEGDK